MGTTPGTNAGRHAMLPPGSRSLAPAGAGGGLLQDEKILVTGPAGRIAFGLARSLAADNEVWGIARYRAPGSREEVEALGVTTRVLDLADASFGDLPRDFTYVLHIAHDHSDDDYDRALRSNAEATGFVLEHCRGAKAALVMSTLTTYRPHPDPWHRFREDDPLGDQKAIGAAPYSVSKIAQEAVARYCARAFELPVVIARMGAAYGDRGGLPKMHLDSIAAGEPVQTRWDPIPYSPIHDDDIAAQLEPLLGAASTPATIVNWCGDDAVSVQEWSAYFGELLAIDPVVEVTPVPCSSLGSVGDTTKRRAITGQCKVHWRDGFRRMTEHLYPDRVR
jgi:nucleoside-diphosphate-sugar epimerase